MPGSGLDLGVGGVKMFGVCFRGSFARSAPRSVISKVNTIRGVAGEQAMTTTYYRRQPQQKAMKVSGGCRGKNFHIRSLACRADLDAAILLILE